MSQLTLALHHASLCLWYGVSGKQRMAIRDLNSASNNLFPAVHGDTLPVTSVWISATVIRLFVRVSQRILQSSRSVVLLEGSVPALLATLFPETILLLLVLQSLY